MLLSNVFVPEHGDRPDVPNTVIVITDGAPNRAANKLKDTVTEVFKRKIKSLAVGVTNSVKDNVLQLISSPPGLLGQDYFKAQAYDTLDNVRVELAAQTCTTRN